MMDPILIAALIALCKAVWWSYIKSVSPDATYNGCGGAAHFSGYFRGRKSGHVEARYFERSFFRRASALAGRWTGHPGFACRVSDGLRLFSEFSGNIFHSDASRVISKKFLFFLRFDVVLSPILKRISVFLPFGPVTAAISLCHVMTVAALNRAFSAFSGSVRIHFNSLGVVIAAPLYQALQISQHENRTA